jgi:hypothetical protein
MSSRAQSEVGRDQAFFEFLHFHDTLSAVSIDISFVPVTLDTPIVNSRYSFCTEYDSPMPVQKYIKPWRCRASPRMALEVGDSFFDKHLFIALSKTDTFVHTTRSNGRTSNKASKAC